MARIKISAAHRDFTAELNSLIRLDSINQSNTGLSKGQLELLTEGVFLSAFRAYENYVEEVFILYTLEKNGLSGFKPKSYLKPRSYNHSRDLIRSSMPFLDWSNPESVMERASIYLSSGEPLRTAIAGANRDLQDMKTLRNQIAHNSKESKIKYAKLLRREYGTAPLNIPSPGRHLLKTAPGRSPTEHYLAFYINTLLSVGVAIAA
ncbi:hypothetical protein DFR31_1986 [Alkalispirillum mobile]|uniref:RiboL-PSP-HEPN domain-containing protein n=1 Tax=Alkalispirillum mobile TaxID=85925 RepID=A0A498C959_9GAMM|nr:hypothetical protein [Alkalispirillum mobile]RLK48871.1 hypothetical protein DFR31_1986 [Alkalispirillum mobile]